MTMTTVDVTAIEPLTHNEAMRLQATELERTLGFLRSLDAGSWTARTDCLAAGDLARRDGCPLGAPGAPAG